MKTYKIESKNYKITNEADSSIWNKMWRKQKLHADENDDENKLPRVLNIFQLSSIGIGSTIGAGIYVLTGTIASSMSGPAVVVSYLFSGVASILSALCYAELSSIYPKSGSSYSYIYFSMGEFMAFIVGWNLILEYIVGSAAILRAFSTVIFKINEQTLNLTIPTISTGPEASIPNHLFDIWSVVFCILIMGLLMFGIKSFSTLNAIANTVNLLAIITTVVAGIFYIDLSNWSNFVPFGFGGILTGASASFFAYVGFDVIASMGDEAKDPTHSIPSSIIITIATCSLLYMVVSSVLTLMAPYYVLSGETAFISAFIYNHNFYITWIVSVGVIFGLAATSLSSMLPAPRILYAMSTDGLLFSWLSIVWKDKGIPVPSTVLSGLLTAILSFFLSTGELVEVMSIGTLIAYSSVCLSVLILRIDLSATSCNQQSFNYYEIVEYSFNVLFSKILTIFVIITFLIMAIVLVNGQDYYEFNFKNHDISKHAVFMIILIIIVLNIISQIMIFKMIESQNYEYFEKNEEETRFKVPLVPFLPLMGVCFNTFLVVSVKKNTWIRFVIWMLIGNSLCFLITFKRVGNLLFLWNQKFQIK